MEDIPNYKITKIQQAKKNLDRVNLFLNGKFWVSLGKDALLQNKLAVGDHIDDAKKEMIEEVSSRSKHLFRIQQLVLTRPRSAKEIRNYCLYKLGVDSEAADSYIDELMEKGTLSDLEFARWWMQNRLDFSDYGMKKIRAELLQKGVSSSIIDELGQEFTVSGLANIAYTKIRKLVLKEIDKVAQVISSPTELNKQKLRITRKLVARGFEYSKIKEILKDEIRNIQVDN